MKFLRNQTWNWFSPLPVCEPPLPVCGRVWNRFFCLPVFALSARKKHRPKRTLAFFVNDTGTTEMSGVTLCTLWWWLWAVGFISSTVLSRRGGFSIYNKWIFISKALTVSLKFWLADRAKIFLFSLHQFIIEINPIMRKLIHNLDMYSWWFLIKFTLTSFLSSANSRISFFTSATKVLASYQSTSKGLSSTISFLLHVTNIWEISKLN